MGTRSEEAQLKNPSAFRSSAATKPPSTAYDTDSAVSDARFRSDMLSVYNYMASGAAAARASAAVRSRVLLDWGN